MGTRKGSNCSWLLCPHHHLPSEPSPVTCLPQCPPWLPPAWWAFMFQLLPQNHPVWVACSSWSPPWPLSAWQVPMLWQPVQQIPVGRTQEELRLKPQRSSGFMLPKKSWNLLATARTSKLHFHWQLPEFSNFGTAKQTASAPAVDTALALAAVGFVGM